MKVLMISIDRGLLGQGQLGDVVERHTEYGKHVDQLDIIIFSVKGFEPYQISSNVKSYPTNSKSKLHYFFDAKKIGQKLFTNSQCCPKKSISLFHACDILNHIRHTYEFYRIWQVPTGYTCKWDFSNHDRLRNSTSSIIGYSPCNTNRITLYDYNCDPWRFLLFMHHSCYIFIST